MIVTSDHIEQFRQDGVVCLRGALAAHWVARLQHAVDRELDAPTMTNLTEMGDALGAAGALLTRDAPSAAPSPRGQFRAGTDHWVASPELSLIHI